MNGQLSIDDIPVGPNVRLEELGTSLAAGERAAVTAGPDRYRVLDALAVAGEGGLTDFELAAWLCRQQTSVGKRRGELRDAALVEATPMRRPAPSGSPSIVWRITPAGYTTLAALRAERGAA